MELTAQDQMFRQLRSLFRRVPFSDRDFAKIAPSVAVTLSRSDPEAALPIFWDILDQALDSGVERDALLALLGFSGHAGNVLDRKMSLDNTVNPRTVSRRADAALETVVDYMVRKFRPARAVALLSIAPAGQDASRVKVRFVADAEMDDPILTWTTGGEVVEHIVSLAERESINDDVMRLFTSEYSSRELSIDWLGSVTPMYFVESHDIEYEVLCDGSYFGVNF